ncbi:hypothetical protein FHQ18_02180 [Deferribacter autotrophicus]|uniref:Two pore domain potassium channel family protein n=1 Tax=Deferribacter autotrophicus TaxID=500465 RepID=A0A5A8F419_9BACT|nr:hypothetical protein [Deferribacter autotrophicus]KAA0258776.1 hypothetical protein FHQ18_02180 [Deferribacter autotrophicus]
MKRTPKSWIVFFWAAVFEFLSYFSLFNTIRLIFPSLRRSYLFVEFYVFCNTITSFFFLVLTTTVNYISDSILMFFSIYGFMRTFEIIIYQINVLLFDEFRALLAGKKYALYGYRRIVILLLHNYLEIACWFGISYMWFSLNGHISFNGVLIPSFWQVFHESLLLMFAYTSDKIIAESSTALAIFTLQAIIGLFMTILVLARFLSLLPNPKSMDEFENK